MGMQVIILAGGLGTRFSEETETKPKPMILIDDKPILWHIMSIYAKFDFSDFIIATGYKSEVIDKWVKSTSFPNWKVRSIYTGDYTQTGGRIRRCIDALPGSNFLITYGDGVGNIDIKNLVKFHNSHEKIASVTAVRPPARFGYLKIENEKVSHFGEKEQLDVGWINGGFFVVRRDILDYIKSDDEPLETGALKRLVSTGELMAYKHQGFWLPMDTRSERNTLARLSTQSPVPWLT